MARLACRAPLGRPRLLLAAAPLASLAALAGGALAGSALRAGAVVACLALLALALRAPAAGARQAALSVSERRPLGRECGVALLAVGGRTLLVGYGAGGVAVLTELERRPGAPPAAEPSAGRERAA